jgi:hypothetical protein
VRDAQNLIASRIAHYEMMMTEPAVPDIHSLTQLLEDSLTQHRKEPQRIVDYIRECRQIGLDVLPFDINRSEAECTVEGEQAVRIGFSLLPSVEGSFVKAIFTERQSNGHFSSFQDFCERLDIEKIPDEFLTHVIQIGGFDSIEASRAALFQGYQTIILAVQQVKTEQATGQFSLFAQPTAGTPTPISLPTVDEWTKEHRIEREKEILGFSFEECLLDIETEEDVAEILPENDEAAGAEAVETEAVETEVAETTETANSIESQTSVEAQVVPEISEKEPLPSLHSITEEEQVQPHEGTPDNAQEATPTVPESATTVVQADSGISGQAAYIASRMGEEPPLPPLEFTADEYEASFPNGVAPQISGDILHNEISEATIALEREDTAIVASGNIEAPVASPENANQQEEIQDDVEKDSEEIIEADLRKSDDHSGEEQPIDDPHAPQLVIQLSTLATTERILTALKHVFQQHPGQIPVVLQCIDIQNQSTRIPIPSDYATDASEDCRAAIAALTGYHAIKLSV